MPTVTSFPPGTGAAEARLAALGYAVPAAATPAANYVPYVQTGDLVWIAGQVPVRGGVFRWIGRVGVDFSLEEGQEAAREAMLNVLGQLKAALGGDLDRVVQVVKLNGFVASPADFTQHPHVMNAASELAVAAFGEAGRHARAAVGVSSLPFGVAVEIDGVFRVR